MGNRSEIICTNCKRKVIEREGEICYTDDNLVIAVRPCRSSCDFYAVSTAKELVEQYKEKYKELLIIEAKLEPLYTSTVIKMLGTAKNSDDFAAIKEKVNEMPDCLIKAVLYKKVTIAEEKSRKL